MRLGKLVAIALLSFANTGCGGDDGDDGDVGNCSGIAEMTGSPSASPGAASAGDTVTITVPVNAPTTMVRAQLLSASDGSGYGDGNSDASGAGDVAVSITIDASAPNGPLYPFVQVYECGRTTVSTQYSPDLSTGTYSTVRSDDATNIEPTSFVAPAVTLQ